MPPAPARREQARRGVAGERDLGARAQPDPRAAAVHGHGAEQDRVADEGEHLEHERERQPAEVAVRRACPRRRGGRRSRARSRRGRRPSPRSRRRARSPVAGRRVPRGRSTGSAMAAMAGTLAFPEGRVRLGEHPKRGWGYLHPRRSVRWTRRGCDQRERRDAVQRPLGQQHEPVARGDERQQAADVGAVVGQRGAEALGARDRGELGQRRADRGRVDPARVDEVLEPHRAAARAARRPRAGGRAATPPRAAPR